MGYVISYADGAREQRYDTYDEARDAVRARFGGDVEIGHGGDLSDGGDRTLFWADAAAADDDDGARALGKITAEGEQH